ncbi:hypothetical protein GDO78_013255 [Eleutherodactylus coqui]|uniref:Uncharacterized protein n=1 Tax=Eleutherodactylus coqui TaxID=57060 RepID=A0A8J6EXY9_ELECQ|nr:hypothetical protein GDO78_013255 [Eleutherodactylus coqui]
MLRTIAVDPKEALYKNPNGLLLWCWNFPPWTEGPGAYFQTLSVPLGPIPQPLLANNTPLWIGEFCTGSHHPEATWMRPIRTGLPSPRAA